MFRNYSVSIVIPVWNGMENYKELLERNLKSILKQDYQNYEIIVSDDSNNDDIYQWIRGWPVKYFRNTGNKNMANNTNYAIDQAKNDLIKILYQDDYFMSSYSLDEIVKHFTDHTKWLVSGCIHTTNGKQFFNPHEPFYSESENTIGSPSVLTFRKTVEERFDPQFDWVLDLDLYRRLFRKYGLPKILNNTNVVIGIHQGQMTQKISNEQKQFEQQLIMEKYGR